MLFWWRLLGVHEPSGESQESFKRDSILGVSTFFVMQIFDDEGSGPLLDSLPTFKVIHGFL